MSGSPSDDSWTRSLGSSISLSSAVASTSTDPIASDDVSWISFHTRSDSLAITLWCAAVRTAQGLRTKLVFVSLVGAFPVRHNLSARSCLSVIRNSKLKISFHTYCCRTERQRACAMTVKSVGFRDDLLMDRVHLHH